jgi:hypothetical protein
MRCRVARAGESVRLMLSAISLLRELRQRRKSYRASDHEEIDIHRARALGYANVRCRFKKENSM